MDKRDIIMLGVGVALGYWVAPMIWARIATMLPYSA